MDGGSLTAECPLGKYNESMAVNGPVYWDWEHSILGPCIDHIFLGVVEGTAPAFDVDGERPGGSS